MKTPLSRGEVLLREGFANYKRGIEAVGGHLFLTNMRLIFESHALNIQTGTEVIALHEVVAAQPCWSTCLGIPLWPNGLLVKTEGGREHRFVVYRRKAWERAVLAAAESV